MVMKIAGIYNSHDTSFCIFEDGKPIIHAEYERYLRLKEPQGDSYKFMKEVVETNDIDMWVTVSPEENVLGSELNQWKSFYPFDEFGKSGKKLSYTIGHHTAHAANALFSSNIDEALIVTIDGGGLEGGAPGDLPTTLGWYYGKGNKVTTMETAIGGGKDDESSETNLGGLWNRYTGEVFGLSTGYPYGAQMGTVMAMAAYGKKDRYLSQMKREGMHTFAKNFEEQTEKDLFDVAAGLQQYTEDCFKKHIKKGIKLFKKEKGYSPKNLCLAGGTVLNSVSTGKLWEWFDFENIYIPPTPGDSGMPVGAVQYVWHHILDNPRITWKDNFTPYLGKVYGDEIINNTIEEFKDKIVCENVDDDYVIDLLDKQNIVSVYGLGAESGRRALGNRSIIADPRSLEMKDMINEKVKHRQWFRPFAPSVLREEMGNWFERDIDCPYMEYVVNVKEDVRKLVPAIVHDNGTARPQSVTENDNKWYYNFIKKWFKKSGVPIVLNTSFNDREPIVETPEDAIKCFLGTNIDALYFRDINKIVYKRSE